MTPREQLLGMLVLILVILLAILLRSHVSLLSRYNERDVKRESQHIGIG